MIQKVLQTIRTRDDFVIVSHVRPDGDSLGSQLALALSLRALGKKVTLISHDPVPSRYEALPASDQVQVADRLDRPFGAAFVLECGTLERPGIGGWTISSSSTSTTIIRRSPSVRSTGSNPRPARSAR